MQRTFLVTLELDPSANIQDIEKEMYESLTYDFPEIVSVKAWSADAESGPPVPIEGDLMSTPTLAP